MSSEFDLKELADRYATVCKRYGELALELAPKLEELGRQRKELQFIVAEFQKRGVELKDPETIKKAIEDELNKRTESNGPTTD